MVQAGGAAVFDVLPPTAGVETVEGCEAAADGDHGHEGIGHGVHVEDWQGRDHAGCWRRKMSWHSRWRQVRAKEGQGRPTDQQPLAMGQGGGGESAANVLASPKTTKARLETISLLELLVGVGGGESQKTKCLKLGRLY